MYIYIFAQCIYIFAQCIYMYILVCTLHRLVSYEVLSQEQETMKAIISSQFIYIFKDGSPDPSSLIEKINLDDLLECRAAQSKTSESYVYSLGGTVVVCSVMLHGHEHSMYPGYIFILGFVRTVY